ncbi:MAG: hypothetical protein LBO74_14075, partial [Candidatus Symbiothrix sp.]|jgi:hypothetical protein|nr:hypothetical protein [Candidatus Symbiothrix sp.]
LKLLLDKTDNPFVIYGGAVFHLIATIAISYLLYLVYNKTGLPWSNTLYQRLITPKNESSETPCI